MHPYCKAKKKRENLEEEDCKTTQNISTILSKSFCNSTFTIFHLDTDSFQHHSMYCINWIKMLKLLGWSVTVDLVETRRRILTTQNSRKSKKCVLPIYYIFCLNILNTPKPFPILRMSLLQGVFLTKTTETVVDHQKHWLRTPNEAFFHWNPELLDLGRYILRPLGYFWPNYQHPFWYSQSLTLAHVFHYSTII